MRERDCPPELKGLFVRAEPEAFPADEDYSDIDLRPEHAPVLMQIATEAAFGEEEMSDEEYNAGIHAWRALGHLKALDQVPGLLKLLSSGHEWADEDVPYVLAMMGPPVIEPLREYLTSPQDDPISYTSAAEALEIVAETDETQRPAVIEALTSCLRQHAANDPSSNGSIIASLLDLHAVDAEPVIEEAYQAGHVNPEVAGEWKDVQPMLEAARREGVG